MVYTLRVKKETAALAKREICWFENLIHFCSIIKKIMIAVKGMLQVDHVIKPVLR